MRTHTALVLAQPAGVVDSCTHRHPPRGTSARRCQPLEPHPTTFCGRSATHCLCCEGELWSVGGWRRTLGSESLAVMPAEGALDEAAPADPWARRMQRHNHRSQLRGQVPRPTPAHATRTSPRASPSHHPRFPAGARGRENRF